ncbi:hypothetical protein MRX96_038556 [Rhipicephalus microplus]
MNDLPETEPGQGEECTLRSLCATRPEPMKIKARVNNVPLVMEHDTDASVSAISDAKFNALFQREQLENTDVRLKSYSEELSAILGKRSATVKVCAQEATLPLLVGSGACPTLFGKDWMKVFGITILKSLDMKTISTNEGLVIQWIDVFPDNLGIMKEVLATISLQEGARPKFFKARPGPFALVDREPGTGTLIRGHRLNIVYL